MRRTMNSQRRPDPTRNNDTLESGRSTDLTAEEILQRLEAVDIMYRDEAGRWKVVPGEENSAWFELGLESDEFITPRFRRELERLRSLGVEVIVNMADETKIDWCNPCYGTGEFSNN